MIDLSKFRHVKIVCKPGRIIVNDGSHGPHNAENPDDGTTSEFALWLADRMSTLGFSGTVHRLE